MKYTEYARLLLNHFDKNVQKETTVAELANYFHCSTRHAKTILHYLKDLQWLEWDIQQGRGKRPKITLRYNVEDILYEQAIHKLKLEKYQEAFQLIQQTAKVYQDKFQSYFQQSLGVSKTIETDTSLDVLRYPFYDTSLCMDPLYSKSRHDAHMIQQIFDRLVEYDPESEGILPRIAHHWESADGEDWVFYLRKGVTFHHGRTLTSEDVKASFLRFPKDGTILRNMKEIVLKDETTIVFRLENKDYLFPRVLAGLGASIVPVELTAEDEEAFQKKPVGSGPYKLVKYDKDVIQLDVFSDYYGFRPWLDRVEIIITPEKIAEQQWHPLLLHAPDASWKQIKVREQGADYITFNTRKPGPMRDKNNRKMVSLAIDPSEFCLEERDETVAHSFLPEKSSEIWGERENARSFVDNEWELKIAAQQIRDEVNHEREALILQNQLKSAGIHATVDIVDLEKLSKPHILDQYDLVVAGIALSEDRLLSLLTSLQTIQLTIYRSLTEPMQKAVEQQIVAIKETPDSKKQWERYSNLENYLKENYCIFFLNHRTHVVYEPENSKFENIALDNNGRVDYRKVWKRKF